MVTADQVDCFCFPFLDAMHSGQRSSSRGRAITAPMSPADKAIGRGVA
jgi:hypothetical protein